MKHLLTLSLFLFFVVCFTTSHAQQAAKSKAKENKAKTKGTATNNRNGAGQESLNMQGAYAMYRQVVNDGSGDSLMGTEQLKIYTDQYMMYAHRRAQDSLGVYGIGKYKVQNGKVLEYVFYTSGNGARSDTFELAINKTGDGYTQIINFPAEQGGTFVLTEDYKRVGKNVTTPLDGAWKQTKRTSISKDGTTRTYDNPTAFKLYQSGYFMWARTWQDSVTNTPISTFGYGTFEMKGPNAAIEVNTHSTYTTLLVGRPVTLQLEFIRKDTFQQTIVFENGNKSIEVYERLK